VLLAAPVSCQVYTPRPLADAMVKALGDAPTIEWLEPCVGEGVFISALAALGVETDRITGIDLNSEPGGQDALSKTTRGIDFLDWAMSSDQRFDRIVGNPPFVSLSKLNSELRKAALKVKSPNGHEITLSSNYWHVFLCASLNLLKPNGSLAFVLPASWDYADYAKAVRLEVLEHFSRVTIYRSRRPLFESVQEGSIILVATGFGSSECKSSRFEFDAPADLIEALRAFDEVELGAGNLLAPPLQSIDAAYARLGDIVDIRLGGVTGAASFFLLTESQRINLGLPVKSLRRVVSKARHLVSGEISSQGWEQLRDSGHRVWLFHPTPAQLLHPAVKRYLDSAIAQAQPITERYKVKIRTPWYNTPIPRNCDGFLSGMSRFGPWISVNSDPKLTATNTLYTISFLQKTSQEEKFAWALSLLRTETRNVIESLGRIYADGLIKHEPGDLSQLIIRRPKDTRGARRTYNQAVEFLLAGQLQRSRGLADRFGWE
jgi:adenine-specific DNA-methyltransferase